MKASGNSCCMNWHYLAMLLFAFVLANNLRLCGCNLEIFDDEDESESINSGFEDSNKPHSRQKRFIYFNTQSPVDIGLLITIPLSFALPTFNLKTSRRFSRSFRSENDLALHNMTSDDILPEDSYDDAAYAIELNKMTTYFTILEVNEDICQQRVICEIFSDAEKFKPISDIFIKKLTVDRGIVEEKPSNRYYRYVKAMQEGITSGEEVCKTLYKKCPYSAPERLNMPALHFWAYLTTLLRMEFRDE